MFAAQAWRHLKGFERSEHLLQQADVLLNSPSASSIPQDEEDIEPRPLQINLRLQRAWLADSEGKRPQYRELMRAIWRYLRFEDRVTSNVLGSLLQMEHTEGILNAPWPHTGGMLPNVDPDNNSLSLPSAWFDGSNALKIENLFEFRFRQLVRLICEQREPAPAQLQLAASNQWWGRERFGEVAIIFGQVALGHTYSPELESLIIDLVDAARVYFRGIEGVDRRELDALQVLMRYKKGAQRYRADYVRVLIEFENLVQREERVRQISEPTNWPDVAIWASSHLEMLMDEGLIRQHLFKNHQTIEQFLVRRDQVTKILEEASKKYEEGDFTRCLEQLEEIPPLTPSQFVLIQDVLVLDLWLKCKQKISDTESDEFNQRATELRKAVLQYIKQMGAVIPEGQVQALALTILSDLQQVATRIQDAQVE
jgi:hypothetical protein